MRSLPSCLNRLSGVNFVAMVLLWLCPGTMAAFFPDDTEILQEWQFADPAGTILEEVASSVPGGASFHASPAASATTGNGTFRIQRPAGTRLFGSAPLEAPAQGKLWIVADIAAWNLESDVSDFRVGFANAPGNPDSTSSNASSTDSYVLAEFSVRRSGLAGYAGGGSTVSRVNPGNLFGGNRAVPIRIVLELDRSANSYTVFYSLDSSSYVAVGSGSVSSSLAPDHVRFMALNSFAQAGTFFDVDRVFVAYAPPPPPPGNIALVGHANPFSQAYGDVGGEGNVAVIGTFLDNVSNGVGIFDISDPANPVLAANYNPLPGLTRFQDVWVRDGIGYFGCWRISSGGGNNGVHIVDLSDPYNPVPIGQINSDKGGHSQVHTLFLDGDLLYTASHRPNADGRTVKVFDISNPANPQFVRSIPATDPDRVHQITVRNGRLFTSGFGGHTDIFDVSDVANAAPLLGTVLSGTNSHSSWPTDDGNVLVSCREIVGGDVRFFDITDPANPELMLVLTYDMVGIGDYIPHNPVILGDLLFLSWYENGLQVFDISNPVEPVRVGFFETGGIGSSWDGNWGVYPFLGVDKVLASDMSNGLFVLDASAVLHAGDNYPPLLARLPESVERVEGSDVEFSVVATGSAPLSYQWHRNGVPIPDANEAVLTLPEIDLAAGGNYTVTVSNGAGEITSRAATLSVMAAGDATPPQINAHPAGLVANTGQMVTFSVTASGTQQLRYQWFFKGEEIPGAEASSLSVGPVMLTDAGSYTVRVWNSVGEVWSEPATLDVEDPGFIYAVRITAGSDGAVVSWRTRELATCHVEYTEGHHHHEHTHNSDPAPENIKPLHAEFDHATPVSLHSALVHSAYIGGLNPSSKYSYSVIAYAEGVRHESPEFLFITADDDKGEEGLPQWWVEHYFEGEVSAHDDMDGDGWSLWAEYLAGTSPIDTASRPQVSVGSVEAGFDIEFWPVHPGRNYRLETSDDLTTWTLATAAEQDEDGRRVFRFLSGGGDRAFYRVVIERQ